MPTVTELPPLTGYTQPFNDEPHGQDVALAWTEHIIPTSSAPVGALAPLPEPPNAHAHPRSFRRSPDDRDSRTETFKATAQVRPSVPVIPGREISKPHGVRAYGTAKVPETATRYDHREFIEPTDEETTHLLGVWREAGRSTLALGRSAVKTWDQGVDVSVASTLRLEPGESPTIVRHRKESRVWKTVKRTTLALGGLALAASDAVGVSTLMHNHEPASFWSAIF